MKQSTICVLLLLAVLSQGILPAHAQVNKIDLQAEPLKTLMKGFENNRAVSLTLKDGSKIKGKITNLHPAGVEINSTNAGLSIWVRYSDIKQAQIRKSASEWLKDIGEYAGLTALAVVGIPVLIALNILSLLINGELLSDC